MRKAEDEGEARKRRDAQDDTTLEEGAVDSEGFVLATFAADVKLVAGILSCF